MGRIIHFEITAADVDRAAKFYTEAFGWEPRDSPFAGGYKVAATGPGAGVDGAIMTREYQSQATIAWLEVDDIDAAMDAVRRAGGRVAGERNTIPGQGHVVYVEDTEGNLLGLKQPLTP
ncbi:VOC family protein [Sphaerisporangium aureirubrum]|uniref:VOC family protein n=1 Tax=Sphaerisporangium aureirubrum TaxID=1544736 RepID=A0ABW1N9M6_9ACTN